MKLQNLILIVSAHLVFMADLFPVPSQTAVQVTFDAASQAKPVSPYIYGKNISLSDNAGSPLSVAQWQFLRDA